jgi:tetratricopeptide (TPR) repeat protein
MNRADRRKTAKTNKERIDEYNEAARQLTTPSGDLQQAQRLLRQVLALDPGDPVANLNLGVQEMWRRNYTKAQEFFSRAYDRDPKNPQILNNLGLSLHEQGGIAEAMPLYEQALQIDPGNTESRVNLARALLHINDRDRALAEARQAVAQKPDFGTAQFILGSVCQIMGLVDEGKAAMTRALELIPGHSEANFRLARLAFDPANPDNYLDISKATYEANADSPEAAITYAEVLFGASRFEEAKEVLSKHLETDIPFGQLGVANGLAHVHANLGDFDESIKQHKRAIAFSPDDASTHYFYGRSLLWSGDYKGASEQLQKAIKALPFQQDLIGMLMLCQKLLGQAEAVKTEMEHLVKVVPFEAPDAYGSIENLNKVILEKLTSVEKRTVHPFDKGRRLANETWEAILGMQHIEPIAAIAEPFQDAMTGYVADMPDGVGTHPLLARKQFGLGSSGSHAESLSDFEDHDFALDQQGWFRIIYFLEVPEEVEDEDKKAGWIRFGSPHFDAKFEKTADLEIKPEAGKAVIFPAYHWFGFNALKAKSPMTFISVQVNSSVG